MDNSRVFYGLFLRFGLQRTDAGGISILEKVTEGRVEGIDMEDK